MTRSAVHHRAALLHNIINIYLDRFDGSLKIVDT